MVPPPLAAPLSLDCSAGWRVRPVYRPAADRKPSGVGSIETAAGLAWFAICRTVWHGSITGGAPLHPYIPYYNRRLPCPVQCPVLRRYLVSVEVLRLMVCPLVWRSWCIGGLRVCCIVCSEIGQINGKAVVKPCKRFWRCGCIICMNGIKAAVNACWQLIRCRAKIKSLHPQQMQGKRKAPPGCGGV